MNINRLREEPLVLLFILSLTVGLFLVRLGSVLSLKITLHQKEKVLRKIYGSRNQRVGARSPESLEQSLQGTLGEEAKAAGVQRLLNIGSASGSSRDLIQLEWEATTASTLQFLHRLRGRGHVGFCERLRVSTADNSLLHVGGSFERSSFDRSSFERSPFERSSSTEAVRVAALRNVFLPLWESNKEDPMVVEAKESKKQQELQKQEQAKLEEERKKREEESRIETTRREMETNLTLTGIVNNGREPLAFVNTRSNGGQTLMLHKGDAIQEARITAIDEQRGEIQLDYQGKFQINLKISSRAGGPASGGPASGGGFQ